MSRAGKKLPGAIAHVLGLAVAMILTALTALTCVLGGLIWSMSDRAMLERGADVILDEQTARLESKVQELAEEFGFAPETVLPLVDRKAAAAYNASVVNWWMALLEDPVALEVPEWSCPEIAQAVMEDEAYQARVPNTQRRTTAVNEIETPLERLMERTALPLRSSLIHAALGKIGERLPLRMAMSILRLLPVLGAGAAAVLALLMLLLMFRSPQRAAVMIGAGLAAGALVTGGVLAMVHLLDIVGQASLVSGLLAMQLRAVSGSMVIRIGGMAAVCGVLGLRLIRWHQRHVYDRK